MPAPTTTYSIREGISHIVRRLGIGARGPLAATSTSPDDAIRTALDLTSAPAVPPDLPPPADPDRDEETLRTALGFWLEQMLTSPRLIEERLVWFWHDHFATSLRKVRVPYLMWRQHLTIRRHAAGSFADLLGAVAVDPAMLVYLDGVSNRAGAINENFGREVMELFTLGAGAFTEDDVVAAARSFSGWAVARPGIRTDLAGIEPWSAVFVRRRHDRGMKTLLGVTGRHDAADAVAILLDQPATAEHVGAKLYRHLVGLEPDEATRRDLGDAFRRRYGVMDLVERIVSDPAFLSDDAIRSMVRAPLDRAVGILQGFPGHRRSAGVVAAALRAVDFVPFLPPNVAGFPEGERLLGPHRLIHGFDLTGAIDPRRLDTVTPDDLFHRLGLFDVSSTSRSVVAGANDPGTRLALAVQCPEYLLT